MESIAVKTRLKWPGTTGPYTDSVALWIWDLNFYIPSLDYLRDKILQGA